MVDTWKLNASKEKILSTLRMKGPSLPVQLAREILFSPLFTSAFLSELKDEGKIRLSHMRVGSSPLYYLPGQEKLLEKFVPYLNQREKEALELLKRSQVLEDSAQTPVVRVALRAIKDFALPTQRLENGETKTYWRYFTVPESEVDSLIKGVAPAQVSSKVEMPAMVAATPKAEVRVNAEEMAADAMLIKAAVAEEVSKPAKVEQKTLVELDEERPLAEKRSAKVKESDFTIAVKDYLGSKEIEVTQVKSEKKKEFEARIRIDTMFGKQEYYLIAKDKKSVSDDDLSLALHKARAENLPAVFMSPGELNKKGKAHLEQWGNLVKYEKLDL